MRIPGALLLALACTTGAQAADDCRLKQVASLDITTLADGDIAVPIVFGGAQHKMILSLTDAFSILSGTFADSQSLRTRNIPEGVQVATGAGTMTKQVIIPDVQIGVSHGADIHVMRLDGALGDPDVVGVLGTDLLGNFDVELDLKNAKLNLFSQDHCDGKVVYWAGAFAAVPFVKDAVGHISIPMTLDGKALNVGIETSAGTGRMGLKTAHRLFALEPDSPGVKPVANPTPGGPALYNYPFKTLSVDGIAINNPAIELTDNPLLDCDPHVHLAQDGPYRTYGCSDLLIRLSELRALHLYFAFKERVLYITDADAHK